MLHNYTSVVGLAPVKKNIPEYGKLYELVTHVEILTHHGHISKQGHCSNNALIYCRVSHGDHLSGQTLIITIIVRQTLASNVPASLEVRLGRCHYYHSTYQKHWCVAVVLTTRISILCDLIVP